MNKYRINAVGHLMHDGLKPGDEYYLACDVDARIAELEAGNGLSVAQFIEMGKLRSRIAELEHELDIRKAAVEAQFGLMEQVKTLTRSNERLRQKIDRLSRSL